MRDEGQLENEIQSLLDDPQYEGHPLREALGALFQQHKDQITDLERLTAISDGYHSALRERNQSLAERYRKQIRQLQKIVRISDHYHEMLRDMNETLKVASTHDPLTGLPNRRLMMERLASQVGLAARRQVPFSVAVADIDFFKRINDVFGHDVGDRVLVGIAQAMNSTLRAYDVCARWGGEEFLILLPETTEPGALAIAERLRVTVAEFKFNIAEAENPIQTTVSVGVATHQLYATLNETIKRADQALYQAKDLGRNRVVVAS